MSALLVVAIVLPVVLLCLGVACGVGLDRLLPRLLARLRRQAPDSEAAAQLEGKVAQQLQTVHVVASSVSPRTGHPAVLQSPRSSPPRPASRLTVTLPGSGGNSLQGTPSTSPISATKQRSSQELGRLMRAGTSVLSQVMDELDTRSAIMRLMSDGVQMVPSPQVGPISIFNAAPSMPAGEVHMDEIDLLERIGKGGYGAVYKASWRQAPVAVKYIVCCTDDHDSLGRAIREVVLSKKMSHPNVVQCYSWTVLTEPDKSQEPIRVMGPLPGMTSTRRSLDNTFLCTQGSLPRQQSLRRNPPNLSPHEELSEPTSPLPTSPPMPTSPFAEASVAEPFPGAAASFVAGPPSVMEANLLSAEGASLPVRIASKHSTESGSGKSGAQQLASESNSPAIAAVRPPNMPAPDRLEVMPLPRGGGTAMLCQQAAGDVHDDAETPAASGCDAFHSTGGSFDDVIAHFQQLASEMYLSRSASLKLSHQPTGSSSFSDVNQGFMLGDSRADTQQESPCSSQAGTPSAAAADSNNSPFRRSRLSRKTSSLTVPAEEAEGLEGSEELQRRMLPSVPSEAGPEPGGDFSAPCSMWPAAPPESEANSLQLPAAQQKQRTSSSGEGVVQIWREPSSQRRSSSSIEGLEVQGAEAAGQAPRLSSGLGLSCPSTLSLAAWQHHSSNSREAGSTRPPSRAGVPRSGSTATESVLSSTRASSQVWRAEAAASAVVPVTRVPSRLGPRPVLTGPGMEQQQQAVSPTALPPGSPPLGRALAERDSSFSTLAGLQVEGSRLSTPKTSPGRGGSPLPAELLLASRENSRSAKKHQRRVEEVIEDELTVDSRTDSFNSEEGFGSPVRNRCGGVKSVFELEGLHLSSQEALMVVVMEYCDLGALRKALKRRAFVPHGKWTFQTTYRALLRTAQEIAKGMEYIHDFDIVHGDLKPGNVLLKTHKVDRRGYIAKVSDFGLSRPINLGETHISMGSAMGTIAYTAPETFATNIAKKPSDVYAFGIMLWEMFYCKDVYDNLLDGQICVGVSDGSLRPEFDDTCPLPYRRLAERCWSQNPDERPPFKDIVKELVQIEVDFRHLTHRQNSSRVSAGSGNASASSTRPPSPEVLRRSRSRAADADFARALQ